MRVVACWFSSLSFLFHFCLGVLVQGLMHLHCGHWRRGTSCPPGRSSWSVQRVHKTSSGKKTVMSPKRPHRGDISPRRAPTCFLLSKANLCTRWSIMKRDIIGTITARSKSRLLNATAVLKYALKGLISISHVRRANLTYFNEPGGPTRSLRARKGS